MTRRCSTRQAFEAPLPSYCASAGASALWVAAWTALAMIAYVGAQFLWHRHEEPLTVMMTAPWHAIVAAMALWALIVALAAPAGAMLGAALAWLGRKVAPMGGVWVAVSLPATALAVALLASVDWPSLIFGLGRTIFQVRVLGCVAPAAIGCALLVLVVDRSARRPCVSARARGRCGVDQR